MIRLKSNPIPDDIRQILDELQEEIDNENTFEKKVEKAGSLWKSKGGNKGKKAFEVIRKSLKDMCVYVHICSYCEQNEAGDIEHIHPKSFFPEKTFEWENYLLACKQCNSGYKLDKCHVLDNNNEIIIVKRKEEPPYKTLAFINPRVEHPENFMILSLDSFEFELLPGMDKKDSNKANSTLQILELNQRDVLLKTRQSAADYYYDSMERLIRIIAANSLEELKYVLRPNDDRFDFTLSLDKLKSDIKESYKKHITRYQHPSVWYAIKLIGSKTDSKWKALFEKIPEALNW